MTILSQYKFRLLITSKKRDELRIDEEIPIDIKTLQRDSRHYHHPRDRANKTLPYQPSKKDRNVIIINIELIQNCQIITKRTQIG